jgi:hypothetical protein
MMTMYDWGCHKHYNTPVPGYDARVSQEEIEEKKRKIKEAEERIRKRNG